MPASDLWRYFGTAMDLHYVFVLLFLYKLSDISAWCFGESFKMHYSKFFSNLGWDSGHSREPTKEFRHFKVLILN